MKEYEPGLSNDEERAVYNNIKSLCFDDFAQIKTAVKNAVATGNRRAMSSAIKELDNMGSNISGLLDNAIDLNNNLAADQVEANINLSHTRTLIQLIVIAIGLAFSVLMTFLLTSLIAAPMKSISEALRHFAETGSLSLPPDLSKQVDRAAKRKDEIGTLAGSFSLTTENIRSILEGLSVMYTKHESGDMDYRIETSGYSGAFKDVMDAVNTMTGSYINMVTDILTVQDAIIAGDFSKELAVVYKGKKHIANEQMQAMRGEVCAIAEEIYKMSEAGTDGELSKRANAERYNGEWRKLIEGLNRLMTAIETPISASLSVIEAMALGEFDASVSGSYKGSFGTMQKSINKTVADVAEYISEINNVLAKISSGNLTAGITKPYLGRFGSIKDSIDGILNSLNKTMNEILSASEQVLSGAKQISSSSMTLAEGACEQASAIEELTASIETINERTQMNAQNAAEAHSLSERSTEFAENGNAEMRNMLESMDKIQVSSNDISSVIKTISDIAFQTNLLALNASVEAARTGEHGRGFAIVAGEVRNLASKSKTSVDDTAALIEDSNSRVNDGTKIAESTADALRVIVENAAQVSRLINTIAEASKEQADAVAQVSVGLSQISQVVQNNSSTSEESAAAAEELNSQAELLREMVSFFRLI